jgi:ammonium transporter, Amt family
MREKNFEAELAMIRTAWYSVIFLAMLCTGLAAQDAANAAAENAAPAVAETGVTTADSPPPPAASTLDKGDQAWLLASSALVLLMTPGLAFFYGGLVGRKNILSLLMQCFLCMALVTLIWVTVGFSLAFSADDANQLFGGFAGNPMTHFMLTGVSFTSSFEPMAGVKLGISQQTFMVFQMMFAIITPALIIGAFAERMKFLAFIVFTGLWSLIVYCPIAHWVWYGPTHPIFGL